MAQMYPLIAQAMRAVFILLAALAVFRSALDLITRHRARRKLLRRLPDAGMVGEMRDIESDISYPLPREGVLGGAGGCDIRLKGLRRRHVTFAFVDGKGVLITPCHRRTAAWLDGAEIRRGAYALHGALLRVGGYTLRIRLFAGLNVPEAALYQDHWRPAYEEELYAPEGRTVYAAQEGFPPVFADYTGDDVPPAFPVQEVPAPDPVRQASMPFPAQDLPPQDLPGPTAEVAEMPPPLQQRHRRSDRRRKK